MTKTLTEAQIEIEMIEDIRRRYDLAELYNALAKMRRQTDASIYWGDSVLDTPILDRFAYKGKGRPRKSDYTTLKNLQRKANRLLNEYIRKERPSES